MAIISQITFLKACRGELCHLSCKLAKCDTPHLAKKLARRRLQLQTKIDAFLGKTPIALGSFSPEDQSSTSGQSYQHGDEEDDEAVEEEK
jgi:hypothetical protein